MKKIVVAIDFSRASRNASEYTASLAKLFHAELLLVHAYKELMPATMGPEPWSVMISKRTRLIESEMQYEIAFLKKKYGIQVSGEISRGNKQNILKKAAEDTGADMVVIGGKRVTGTSLFSFTIMKSIRKVNRPVLIVPEDFKFGTPKNIVLAVDFTEKPEQRVINFLLEIVHTFDASLRVVNIERRGYTASGAESEAKTDIGIYLAGVSYLYDQVEYKDVSEGIRQFTDTHPTDLLVMIAHSHSLFDQISRRDPVMNAAFETQFPLLVLK
ncbi:MAG: universal stress protein [Chitinophagaceae bacterium]